MLLKKSWNISNRKGNGSSISRKSFQNSFYIKLKITKIKKGCIFFWIILIVKIVSWRVLIIGCITSHQILNKNASHLICPTYQTYFLRFNNLDQECNLLLFELKLIFFVWWLSFESFLLHNLYHDKEFQE